MVTSHWTDVHQCIQFANDKAVTLKLSLVNTQCRSAFELVGFNSSCLSNPITRRLWNASDIHVQHFYWGGSIYNPHVKHRIQLAFYHVTFSTILPVCWTRILALESITILLETFIRCHIKSQLHLYQMMSHHNTRQTLHINIWQNFESPTTFKPWYGMKQWKH